MDDTRIVNTRMERLMLVAASVWYPKNAHSLLQLCRKGPDFSFSKFITLPNLADKEFPTLSPFSHYLFTQKNKKVTAE
jgi:hypothetical protein